MYIDRDLNSRFSELSTVLWRRICHLRNCIYCYFRAMAHATYWEGFPSSSAMELESRPHHRAIAIRSSA